MEASASDSSQLPNGSPLFVPNHLAGTLYIPIASPPTPAPSPGPSSVHPFLPPLTQNITTASDPAYFSRLEFSNLASLPPSYRLRYLASILGDCTPSELLFISTTIAPLLKRDFIKELPIELALHVFDFVHDPKTLCRAAQVSKRWQTLLEEESIWKRMCDENQFSCRENLSVWEQGVEEGEEKVELLEEMEKVAMFTLEPPLQCHTRQAQEKGKMPGTCPTPNSKLSYKNHFRNSYVTEMNWRHGGHLLRAHRVPVVHPDNGVITSLALDADWVVVGLANSRIHVFSARTGVLARTLIGHDAGVWAVNLVSRGGYWRGPEDESEVRTPEWREGQKTEVSKADMDAFNAAFRSLLSDSDDKIRTDSGTGSSCRSADSHLKPMLRAALGLDQRKTRRRRKMSGDGLMDAKGKGKASDAGCASEGWGQPNALVVSGGCDKVLKVWDVPTGHCIYTLTGHTSTIRCIRLTHNRPLAVTGSRDTTVRVWDIQRGKMIRVLRGHTQSVRCLDVFGNKAVSGSYDASCRLWDIDTGTCIHVLQGHFHQIYSVAFDGVRIASGGLDTTVRVWDADTGQCLALLQGHTALVCQLQLSPELLATGGSDGRVITFSLSTYTPLHRIAAHDSSVTSLQFDHTFLVTGGNDGRVRLYETKTGSYVRDLNEGSESVWKVAYRGDRCAIMCKRAGKTVMEIWSFKPREGE